MRFRSNLTGGTLYGRRGRQTDTSWRRLRTLSLALIAVLLLMQQASDPAVYRNFFTKLGVPLSDSAAPAVVAMPEVKAVASPPPSELPSPAAAVQFLDSLGAEQIANLTQLLADYRAEAKIAGEGAELGQLRTDLLLLAGTASLSGTEEQQVRGWSEALEQPTAPAGQKAIAALDAWLQPMLDQRYVHRARDATVWQTADANALYRYLERTRRGTPLDSVTVSGVLPLLEQAEIYRGSAFEVSGTAVRAEAIEAGENPFGITRYWMVWLNPDDGSNRPLVAYAPDVPEPVRSLSAAQTTLEGPPVVVRGIFVKRLLYQSGAGAELAPLLVGSIRATEPARLAAEEEAAPGATLSSILLAALCLAILVAGWIFWMTQREHVRRRHIRDIGKPAFNADAALRGASAERGNDTSERGK